MPNVLSANSIYEIVVQGICFGQAILNVLHCTVTATGTLDPDVDNEEGLLNSFRDLWRALMPDISEEYTVQQYRIRGFSSTIANPAHPGAPPYLLSYLTETIVAGEPDRDTGESAGDCSPTFDSVGVIKRTNRPGREFRGAMRLPPVPDTGFTGNLVTPALRDDIQAIVNGWLGPTNPGAGTHYTYSLGVFRRTAAVAAIQVLAPATFCRTVTAFQVRSLASSQVSRKQKKTLGA